MFEKNMRIAYLLDFYGDTLDGHVLEVMRNYYNDDLSLAEIASGFDISRQGVRHLIKKGEEQLEFLESALGLAERHEQLTAVTEELNSLRSAVLEKYGDREMADKIESIIGTILKGN